MDRIKFPENNFNINKEFKVSKVLLNFLDPDIENSFREQYFKKSLFSFRVSFVVVIILYAIFGFLDYTTSSDFFTDFILVRFLIVIPLLLLVFFLSFHKIFASIWQTLLSICFVISGSGIIYMLLRNPDNIFYYGGMFLIFLAGYFFIKLRFIYAMVSGLLVVIIYNFGALYFHSTYDTYYHHLFSTNAFYISANIISMFALYNIEYLKRRDFYQRLLIHKSKENIILNNLNLESQVKERTKLLAEKNKSLITEIKNRKIIEKKLITSREKAVESDRLKTAFLHNISHEIRTPMNGILGFGSLLKDTNLTGEKQQQYVDVIMHSGKRMVNTLNDLMDISMLETGQIKPKISTVNINDELNSLLGFYKFESEKKGLILEFDNSTNSHDLEIDTDREKLYAILSNLVKNSIKYSSKGIINFGYKFDGKFLKFYVKDQGIGIPKDRQIAIFERFVQADIEDVGAFEGNGLGLAISKAYVEMLGGKIWVNSVKNQGSDFNFTLPYTLSFCETEIKKNKVKDSVKVNFAPQKLKILIAEDEDYAESFLNIILKEINSELLHVENGLEAIKKCKENQDIDLILMDIKMPEMDGYEATREIRKFNKEVVIIAQTAYALVGDREKAINAGCNDYISKPIHFDKLMELIVKYFNDSFINN